MCLKCQAHPIPDKTCENAVQMQYGKQDRQRLSQRQIPEQVATGVIKKEQVLTFPTFAFLVPNLPERRFLRT
jgi:hypothetical protein